MSHFDLSVQRFDCCIGDDRVVLELTLDVEWNGICTIIIMKQILGEILVFD